MLYLIGLGLGDAKDITVKGLEIVRKVDKVYLENYTSILCCGQSELEELYERPVIIADREMLEQGCKEILDSAQGGSAAVLVVGDPLNATTHTDLLLRATERKIPYKIIHNASILNAVACCGLQIYSFGETVSIPFWTDTWKPESFYDKIIRNRMNGLHTLCLLDIKVKEPNYEQLMKGRKEFEPPRFMSIKQAAEQIISIIDSRDTKSGEENVHDDALQFDKALSRTSLCIGLARVGSSSEKIIKTTFAEATQIDLGPPLHSLVIPGVLHHMEEEMLNFFTR